MGINPDIGYFIPKRTYIASIASSGNKTIVTTTEENGYSEGLYVRILYPQSYGMTSLINKDFLIHLIDSTSFSIDADTSKDDPFSIPVDEKQSAQVVPSAEAAFTLDGATVNSGTIPPSYSWKNVNFPWVNRP